MKKLIPVVVAIALLMCVHPCYAWGYRSGTINSQPAFSEPVLGLVFTSPVDASPSAQVGATSYLLNTPVCQSNNLYHCIDVASSGTLHSIISYTGSDGTIVVAPAANPTPNCFMYTATALFTGIDSVTFTVQNDLGETGELTIGIHVVHPYALPQPSLNLYGQFSTTITAVNPDPLSVNHWEVLSGSAVLADPDSLETVITGLQLGGNLLQWVQVYPCGIRTAYKVINVFPGNAFESDSPIQFTGDSLATISSCAPATIPSLNVTDDCPGEPSIEVSADTLSHEYCRLSSALNPANSCGYPTSWSLALFGMPNNEKWYKAEDLGFRHYDDGRLHVYGTVVNAYNPNARLILNMWLYDEKTWDEWSNWIAPASYKADCDGVSSNHIDWLYYKVGYATATGLDDLQGTFINFDHAPSNMYFGMQLGIGANNITDNYGIGGWLSFHGNFQNSNSGLVVSNLAGTGDFCGDASCCGTPEITLTYNVENDCLETSSATQIIDVIDATAPILTNAPPSTSIVCESTFTPWVATWSDDCSALITEILNTQDGSVYHYFQRATDGCGNTDTIFFDQQLFSGDCALLGCMDPTACNYDGDATTDDGSCFHAQAATAGPDISVCDGINTTAITAAFSDPNASGYWTPLSSVTISDGYNSPEVAGTDQQGGATVTISGLHPGANNLLWHENYYHLDGSSCAQNFDVISIYVYDGTPPMADPNICGDGADEIFLCGVNSMTLCGSDPAGSATATWTIQEGCGTIGGINNPSAVVSNLCLGTNAIQYWISNGGCAGGETIDTLFIYVGNDLTCPDPVYVLAATEPGGTWVDITSPGCGIAPVTNDYNDSENASDFYSAGQTIVTWTDGLGNTCTQFISVLDDTAPVLECPNDQLFFFGDDCTFTLPDYRDITTVTDNGTVSLFQAPLPGSTVSGASVVVTITAQDESANTTSCIFTATAIDASPPELICIGNQFLMLDGSCSVEIPDYTTSVSAMDNCYGPEVLSYNQSPPGGTLLTEAGSEEVTISATNPYGVTGTCTFYLVVDGGCGPGCTDLLACNYSNNASSDDGSCIYGTDCNGCTDPAANNYESAASADDGSCVYNSGIVVYYDLNGDGTREAGEPGLQNWPVYFAAMSATIYSNDEGFIDITLPTSTFTIELINTTDNWVSTSPTELIIEIPLDINASFGVMPVSGEMFDIAVPYNGFFDILHCTAGAESGMWINNSGASSISGVLTMTCDEIFAPEADSYSSIAPDITSPGFAQWTITDYLPGSMDLFSFHVDGPGIEYVGETFEFNVHLILMNDLGEEIYNESWVSSRMVSCSYDPNDLTARPVGLYEPHYILAGEVIEYKVRFQNIGNIPAQDILVLDHIDQTVFDVSTFQPLYTSASVTACLHDDGVVDFIFNDINLPGSASDESGSHGFAVFTLKAWDDLVPGTVLINEAEIFFDENPMILTNEVFHTIFDCTSFSGITRDGDLCPGEEVTLSAEQEFVDAYQWTIDGEDAGIFPSISFTNVAGSYTLGVYVSNPLCGALREMEITVAPEPTIAAGDDMEICSGESITLNATGDGSIEWSNGVANGASFVPVENILLMASATNEFECTATDAISIVVVPIPGIDIQQDGATLTAPDGSEWDWYLDGDLMTASGQSIIVTTPGTYFVITTNGSGCTSQSGSVVIISVDERSKELLSVYPNPVHTSAIVRLPFGTYEITISDMAGKTLQTYRSAQGQLELQRGQLAAGQYQLMIRNSERTMITRLILD